MCIIDKCYSSVRDATCCVKPPSPLIGEHVCSHSSVSYTHLTPSTIFFEDCSRDGGPLKELYSLLITSFASVYIHMKCQITCTHRRSYDLHGNKWSVQS